MGERIEKIKSHFKENKKVYVAVGVTGLVAFFTGKHLSGQSASQTVLAVKAGDVHQNIIQTNLPRRGHPGNVIICNETGVPFSSQNQAAEMMGLSKSDLSRHLNGKRTEVNGHTFTKVGEAV